MSSVAIIGPGAIGGLLAARLVSRTAHSVEVCARTPLSRLTLEAPDGRFEVAVQPALSPDGLSPVDWVLVCVKAHQTDSAGPWLKALCGPKTKVAILQNGVEHRGRVGPWAPRAALLPVVVRCPAQAVGPGHSIQSGLCHLTVEKGSDGEAFGDLLQSTGVVVELTDDFTTAAWRKLCANATLDAVTVLPRRPRGVLLRPDVAALARNLFEEAVAVARASGARLGSDAVQELCDELHGMAREAPEVGHSMMYDVLAGKRLEIEARGGAVVRFGAKHGVPTPLHAAVVALLWAASAGA